MHKHASLSNLELHDVEHADAKVRAVGYELRPEKMRPTVWVFEAGGSGPMHRQTEQEELYHVLSGRFEMVFADDDGTVTETLELASGDIVVVSPNEVRQLRCLDAGEVFVVGAPNVKDDGVVVD
ncbi:cupin domain-containing protein (plasmid) [Haloferax mediterranei ATCC 33500]|uniref:Cupin domain-containing protein n=1 Tax=Haloferax mediterranei (strain ATCC 33500 / DSM 1411 / JCM 8866 / NBRC 14739 / NCIMB 2177 / R-4) TaxID=523841 RepID=I3RB60_HALMT|nr:cupin domain-containing protein [Haloferax mediterranei]AFK21470.1 hypothetical protein HFX_6349 [Haloferax mediterranei ATCC 33500]AHZ24467.1 hypothetical protein BM92_16265 [Haloferax mediterranei ATCC 33500]ELZ97214.1 hypothetical protein C439_17868 [Haloferax mediterranei ATCC 33500]MDX5990048.1 cupin domain-containing protein [Haloferax mediterranei ATCC 33500]QCQ76865.1 cupin domain-containing protein [Haloferax mediterranei ATCC 33500]